MLLGSCLKRVRIMVFNVNFNSIPVISWASVLLMEETGGPGKNHRPVACHCHNTFAYIYIFCLFNFFLWVAGLWSLSPLSTHFQLYRGGKFNGGRYRSTWRKRPIFSKSLTLDSRHYRSILIITCKLYM